MTPRILVENCIPIPIQPLFTTLSPGTTRQTDYGNGLMVRYWLDEDGERGWIELVGYRGKRWSVICVPHDDHDWIDSFYYIIGENGEKHKFLLVIMREGRIIQAGVRSSLHSYYACQKESGIKQRIRKRNMVLVRLGMSNQPAWDLNRAFVPIDGGDGLIIGAIQIRARQKGEHRRSWWKRWKKLNQYHVDFKVVEVKKPVKMFAPTFHKYINYLNKSLIKTGRVKAISYVKTRRSIHLYPKWHHQSGMVIRTNGLFNTTRIK